MPTQWFSQSFYTICFSVLFSTILPITAIAIRQTVKKQRTEIIRDLRSVFEFGDGSNENRSVASFEFVKYKYHVNEGPQRGRTPSKDFPLLAWALAAIPFVVVTLFTYLLIFDAVFRVVFAEVAIGEQGVAARIRAWFDAMLAPAGGALDWIWILAIAAIASYIAIIRDLFRAIHTFDVAPATLIQMSIEFIFGISMALIVFFIFLGDSGVGDLPHQLKYGALLVTAFVCGYIPEAGVRYMLQTSRLSTFKRDDSELYNIIKATPIEVIDGIDVRISSRLADHEIYSVQNLAAFNPILIFVETPYGIYQAIDWVAQAQLFCTAGPYAVIELWKLGIRTIFDLERAALDPLCSTSAMRAAVARALSLPLEASAAKGGLPAFSDQDIIANIQNRLNDCHVQRLRQIVGRIKASLKPENERLCPVGWREAPRRAGLAAVAVAVG